ncbi:MAG: hypothetical protein PVF13_07245 [Chromatiales bacterium]|jgi:hypothetical protein
MTYNQNDVTLKLAPVSNQGAMSRGRRWFSQVVMQCSHPLLQSKPDWVHLPDRVWRRQSALLVSLRERDRDA